MKEKLKNKKVVYTIIGVVALILVTIGITYAYWLVTKTQTKENVISSGCLDITLDNETNDITLTNQFPINDEEGKALTPYTFTITNNCNTSVDYHVNLESIGDKSSALAATTIKAILNDSDAKVLYDYVGADTTIDGAYEAYTLGYGTLSAKDSEGSSKSYSLRLWIDEDAPISEMNKTYTSRISVSVGQGVSAGGIELASLILEDAETNNYLYTTTPDFSKVTEDGEYGLYSAADDYGTSYYFRGDVENNYVKFGSYNEDQYVYRTSNSTGSLYFDGYDIEDCEDLRSSMIFNECQKVMLNQKNTDMYWRIVRINGDGTIRLIYDGTSAESNGVGNYSAIAFAPIIKSSVPANVATYVYNNTDTYVKQVIDNWYESYLKDNYHQYLADSIFCNDTTSTKTLNGYEYFGVYNRLEETKVPSLICSKETDMYTVNDTKGNGLLKNPIALITADEAAMAGVMFGNNHNRTYYLYREIALGESKDSKAWTMSPYNFSYDGATYNHIYFSENLSYSSTGSNLNSLAFVRPVINLKADVLFEGNGTIDSPYEIVMN